MDYNSYIAEKELLAKKETEFWKYKPKWLQEIHDKMLKDEIAELEKDDSPTNNK